MNIQDKAYMDFLEAKNAKLTKDNEALKDQVKMLMQRVRDLKCKSK